MTEDWAMTWPGAAIIMGVTAAFFVAVFIVAILWPEKTKPPLAAMPTNGTFSIRCGDRTVEFTYDASAEDIDRGIRWLTEEWRDVYAISGASNEEEFFTHWDCRPQPWRLLRNDGAGHFSYKEFHSPEVPGDGLFAYEKDGVVYTERWGSKGPDLERQQRLLAGMCRFFDDYVLFGEDPEVLDGDTIIRSEN